MKDNAFGAAQLLQTPLGALKVFNLGALKAKGIGHIDRLPYSIKVLLEAVLRNQDGFAITPEHVEAIARYNAKDVGEVEIPFKPGRVVLQDFTGVPAVVDLAALRSAMARLGGDVSKVNPLVRCDLVIDHSVQVDAFGSAEALDLNTQIEFERNQERYEFLKWGQQSFKNFNVVPPSTGIIHQVNLEALAKVVLIDEVDGELIAYPDSLVGTDSHTTMINGLGVVGWGVGGIEAEAVMLGQPIYMLLPEVIGVRLSGAMPEGATATDLVLRVTQLLRARGVVGKFVEFTGPALDTLSLPDRATIANMAPEYGATMGFFPVDEQALLYLQQTGRGHLSETVKAYSQLQGLWRDESLPIEYTDLLELDLSSIEPALAGPKRPQDRVALSQMKAQWTADRAKVYSDPAVRAQAFELNGEALTLKDGDVVIASITSCTNTSNPSVLIAAGLVAKKARALGLKVKPWVKTSLAPGSRTVGDYLDKAGLTPDLDALGFHIVGYGCTTCIGNSGPVIPEVGEAIKAGGLRAAAVLSGNRNFEGRVNPLVQPSYLASPPLVVAYALAGTVDLDLINEPLGEGLNGPVYLKDVWPSNAEVASLLAESVTQDQFELRYAEMKGPQLWQDIEVSNSELYSWSEESTYIQEPPFFVGMSKAVAPITPIEGARVLVKVANSVTTDHISPAGDIPEGPAARYLEARGVLRPDFNSFGSRRGNDRVMTRGTFANIRLRNELAPGTEGGWTTYFGADAEGLTRGQQTSIYEASLAYKDQGTPLVVLAGTDYGMGSSRDWAAKGTFLLGVKAVIAESYERIHRSNLVGMGVLPLQFKAGEGRASLGLKGDEVFSIFVDDALAPLQDVSVVATRPDGSQISFDTVCRIDTPVEVDYYRNGGILHTVLRRMASEA
ncbi:aconitate hydratase AcnA [Myxococcota bacterium]|nr:aconitate hydratase AcnA [Myxococcota bacterium]MBU1899472.1 aconitate hydratase AcnA [Myxococcota bacterium]